MNMSVTSAIRGLSPVVGGSLLAWSSQSGLGFPFDYHFAFLCCGVCALAGILVHVSVGSKSLQRRSPLDIEEADEPLLGGH
jgi:hypothetical protein